MYFTDDSLLPENMPPLMITAAPYGPVWMPQDCTPEQKLPVTWDEQTQAAVDCFNAGATILHIHVRDPKSGHISKNFKEYGEQIARLRKAVPEMILQVGGSISFAPEPGEKAPLQMIQKQVDMAKLIGRPIATADETRQTLKIGVTYKTTEETLASLGLPPNRKDHNKGFLVHETDGKFRPAAQGGCGHIHAGEWEEEVKASELAGTK